MTTIESPDLLDRVAALIRDGRTGAARPLLAAAHRAMAPEPRIGELSALVEMRDGNLAAARDHLDRGIDTWPQYSRLRKLRAELRMHLADLPGALMDAADCVIQEPDDPAAKALLGSLLLESGHAEDAVTCLREAAAADSRNPAFVQALAAAQEAVGDVGAGEATLHTGIANMPGNGALRNTAILQAIRQRAFSVAVDLAQDARRDGLADACMFGLLGHALSSLDRHAEAADAYQEALKLGPDDPYVRHLVAASGVVASASRAPDDYVRTVFDGYAERFEEHLIGLGYRVPGLIRAALLRHRPRLQSGKSMEPALDLGCGTGLLAVALSDLPVRSLVGVDLSPRMLALAGRKGLYTDLRAEEICAYLEQDARQYPLIFAADVLCYFGDLSAPFSAISRKLAPGGLSILTVEQALPAVGERGWVLGRQGRFAHDQDYVRHCADAAGLKILELRQESLRQEAAAPVAGFLVVMENVA